jgi:NTP pyrophosphatase (non-canonical NTP hydrolase)
MMDAKYIETQSASIHFDNRKKGFWDNPRSPKIVLGLICSEMMEAFEGIRKHKRANPTDALQLLSFINPKTGALLIPAQQYADYYEATTKDTVEAELAGTSIRCFDTIGGRLFEAGGQLRDAGISDNILNARAIALMCAEGISNALTNATRVDISAHEEPDFLAELLVDMMPCALGVQTGGPEWREYGIARATTELAAVCDTLKNMCLLSVWFGIDLKTHILLEVTYNRTRPQKHGDKRF